MRTLLALLLAYLLPARGKRRADEVPLTVPPTAPVRRPLEVLRGEDVALVRPYLVAFERQRELCRQRERRTALVLATAGIDYQELSA